MFLRDTYEIPLLRIITSLELLDRAIIVVGSVEATKVAHRLGFTCVNPLKAGQSKLINANINILTLDNDQGLEIMRHTLTAQVLAKAVKKLYPDSPTDLFNGVHYHKEENAMEKYLQKKNNYVKLVGRLK